jgi:hypothetical protein
MPIESIDKDGCCTKTSSQVVVDFPGSQGLPGDLPLDLLADEGANLITVDLVGCLKVKYPAAKTIAKVVAAMEAEICGTKKAVDIVVAKPVDTCLLTAATDLQALVELLSKRSCPESIVASGSVITSSSPSYTAITSQGLLTASAESIQPGTISGSTTYTVRTSGIFNLSYRTTVKPQAATAYDLKIIVNAKKLVGGAFWTVINNAEVVGDYIDTVINCPISLSAGEQIYFDVIVVANNIATGALDQIPIDLSFNLRMAKQWAL